MQCIQSTGIGAEAKNTKNIRVKEWAGPVMHACGGSTWRLRQGGLSIQSQPRLYSGVLSQKANQKKQCTQELTFNKKMFYSFITKYQFYLKTTCYCFITVLPGKAPQPTCLSKGPRHPRTPRITWKPLLYPKEALSHFFYKYQIKPLRVLHCDLVNYHRHQFNHYPQSRSSNSSCYREESALRHLYSKGMLGFASESRN